MLFGRRIVKKTFYTELSYLVGIVAVALGVALMEAADFGVSMIVAPAYLCYLKLSQILPFFTFGMAEYLFQALLLAVLCLVLKKFRLSFFFSFVTAVVYGLVLDATMLAVALLPDKGFFARILLYLAGMVFCAIGVACMFHTYVSPEVYELFVKELARKLGKPIPTVKTAYDCVSCALGVVLSFAFFGFGTFEGVKLGTILCALVNGRMIGAISTRLEAKFAFRDALALRPYFEDAVFAEEAKD